MSGIGATGWAAIATVFGSFVGWLTTRGKMKGDLTAVLSATAIDLMNELRSEVGRLSGELDTERAESRRAIAVVRAEVIDCERRHDKLEAHLRAMGVDLPDE